MGEFYHNPESKEIPNKIVARAILLNEEDKVLLGKRMRGGGVGKWALVGGKPDINENPEQAIIREVQEELGVTFDPTLFEKVEDQQSQDRAANETQAWDVYFYYGRFKGQPQPKPDEISEIAYAGKEDLDEYEIAFNHKEELEKFFQFNLKTPDKSG